MVSITPASQDKLPRHDALGEFEQSVLLAVAHLGPDAYGLTVRREIERRTRRSVAVGALYTALDRLERKGYVSSAMSDPTPQRGGRSKRHFQLRAAGVTALREARERMNRMWAGLPDNLKSTSGNR
jgi:DNA-binding PadR family transcriptional regulator